jgi:quercetin dioxygenase-like cupin family protein
MSSGSFRIASEIEAVKVPFGSITWVNQPSTTGTKQLTVLDGVLFPGQGHNFHKHSRQEEVIYVVAGTIEQWVDQEKRVLGPGDAAFIPAGVVHGSFNIGKGDARLLAIFGPCVDDGFEAVDMAQESPWKELRA